ncbi:hypothetical protein [Anaerocolumna chitinilytica]|uniref:Uncharacterized protein n=1 Tax=Anaerocolumna chitinilytica TaxID=1727145 RepID=A0A7I8DLH4_9FIRM|nr:hypothetical protein [Anaerocolumna chitinilytica]BCJ98131.1 hypothetical protein bsdcttw_11720 [Anaerocolumna chitinilytica]
MKRLKYLFMALVMVTCLVSPSGIVSASSYSTGKAVIPWYVQSSSTMCGFSVSNITDKPINVTITLYNSDGTILLDDNSASTGFITGTSELLNYCDQNTDSTLTFTLNAHSTGTFQTYYNTISKSGYGVIKWEQDGTAIQGLVAHGGYQNKVSNTVNSAFAIPINGGLPF